jgi:hypothetical protein
MSKAAPDDSEKLIHDWSEQHYLPNQVRTVLQRFLKHLGKSARQVLEEQAKASRSDDPDEKYKLMDELLEWVNSLKLRRSTKRHMVTAVRSFFNHYRRPLPSPERVRLQRLTDDHDEVIGRLDPDTFDTIIHSVHGDPRTESMLLAQLQSFSGPGEVVYISNKLGLHIAQELRRGSSLIELHFPRGRKTNPRGWFTYLGADACDSLRAWFKVRGWPGEQDSIIWPSRGGRYGKNKDPLTTKAAALVLERIAIGMGLRPKPNGILSSRYGVSIKEIRDLALSLSQRAVGEKNSRGEPYIAESSEYFCGHNIDHLAYRRLHELDPEYRRRQYKLVEPYLSPLSHPRHATQSQLEAQQKRMEEMQKRIEALEIVQTERLVLANNVRRRQKRRKR